MRKFLLKGTVALSFIFLAVSCGDKIDDYSGTDVNADVNFDIMTSSLAETKTVYSGYRTEFAERIDWESGDVVQIFSATSVPHNADYKAGDVTASSYQSTTEITPVNSNRIKWWGDENFENVFYAVYPSPSVKSGDSFDNGIMKGNIPADQESRGIKTNTTKADTPKAYVAVADLKNEYMLARTATKYVPSVELHFIPMTTAIEFTVTNSSTDSTALLLKSVSVQSKDHNISGTFTADLPGKWTGEYGDVTMYGRVYPECKALSPDDGGKKVSIDFSGTDICAVGKGLAYGETLTFTLFLRPTTDADDLTFTVERADESKLSTNLVDKDGKFIKFPCYKKSYVKGILVPEGEKFKGFFLVSVETWEDGGKKKITF